MLSFWHLAPSCHSSTLPGLSPSLSLLPRVPLAGNESLVVQKKVSIVLDTHIHVEQDDYAVSLIIARLPLRSPSAFSLRAKLNNRALRGECLLGWLFSAPAANKLPVRRTGLHAQDRSDSRPRQVINSPHARIKSNFWERVKHV